VCGYLRGRNLSANSLVYFPSLGTYQMSEIHALERTGDKTMQSWELVQKSDPALQETLDNEAIFDQMNAEQTWPTEQDLKEAQIKTVKKRVPKGTSEYQAAWILDSEEEEEVSKSEYLLIILP
jgi:pre-rRNA-processing protein TSR1